MEDNLIPPLEAEYLADQVRGQAPVRLLTTGAISRPGVERHTVGRRTVAAGGFLGRAAVALDSPLLGSVVLRLRPDRQQICRGHSVRMKISVPQTRDHEDTGPRPWNAFRKSSPRRASRRAARPNS